MLLWLMGLVMHFSLRRDAPARGAGADAKLAESNRGARSAKTHRPQDRPPAGRSRGGGLSLTGNMGPTGLVWTVMLFRPGAAPRPGL